MKTTIYEVHDARANPAQTRLVRAANRSQALRHVAQDSFAVSIATQNSLVFLIERGVKVEDASVDPAPAANEPAAQAGVEPQAQAA